MPRSPNISYYHYSSEELDADNNVIDIRFYMTLRELESKFNKSRTTFHRVMVDPNRMIKSLPNFRFKKVHLPVYRRVINDVFSPALVAEMMK
jgi:hypothetical protein